VSLFTTPTDELLSLSGIRRSVSEANPDVSDVAVRLIVEVTTTRSARLENRMMVPLSRVSVRVSENELPTPGEAAISDDVLHGLLRAEIEVAARISGAFAHREVSAPTCVLGYTRALRSPRDRGAVGDQGRVGRDDCQRMHEGLGDEQAVEGVSVVKRELAHPPQRSEIDHQVDDPSRRQLFLDPHARRCRQVELARLALVDDLPDADMAEEELIVRVIDGRARDGREAERVLGEPDESAGVEEEPQRSPHSDVSAPSSGAKQSSEYVTGFEVTSPTRGRSRVWVRNGTSLATGTSPRHTTISSPDSVAARSFERVDLASCTVTDFIRTGSQRDVS